MTPDDAAAVLNLAAETFSDLDVRLGGKPHPPPPEAGRVRHRHLAETDAAGCWVTTDGDAITGAAEALLREGVWGLSLLIVRPDLQSGGLGRQLMDAAVAYGEGSRGGIILASEDARALRTYWRAGFALRPAFDARGAVKVAPPADPSIRPIRWPEDRDLIDAVGRHVRGASHGPDIASWLEMDASIAVHEGGGYCIHSPGRVRGLAATDPRIATALLETALAGQAGEVDIDFLDHNQGWAIDVVLKAGLTIKPGGAVCVRGEVGPMHPYLPTGAYL